ncbi:MAG: DnaJ domain-containing protein, partial [Rhodospirillaceae bacterium]|nr:DnaJ domain-containing protein [Rhodospirillaceae bacterium]
MLPSLLLGILLLGGVLYFLQWYGNAKTEDVKKTLRWGAIIVGLFIVALLAITGRLGAAMAFLAALFGWAWRAFHLVQMGRQMSGAFKGFARTMGGGAKANTSQVQSAFLTMTLDHDTGHLDGQVVQGRFSGRALSSLPLEDLMTLAGDVQTDAESAALLESFLDRAHPDWRERGTTASKPSAPSSMMMSEEEALQILGLSKGAGPDDIKSAYRRLMALAHPDKGGTDYLAAKINAAKDFLLGG